MQMKVFLKLFSFDGTWLFYFKLIEIDLILQWLQKMSDKSQ